MNLKTIEQYEDDIKSIQDKIKKLRASYNAHKMSNLVKERIVAIVKNKNVQLSNGELNYILEPLVNRENYIAKNEKKDA